jgi:hypothetical protein
MPAVMRDNEFEHTLDEWVQSALHRGLCTFSELVRSLPGVYPADAARAVKRLRIELPREWQVVSSHSTRPSLDNWPVEHPLDFDWRFTPETVRFLIDQCPEPNTGSTALLGAPSLAREAANRGRQTDVSLFDCSPALLTAVQDWCPGITVTCTDLVWGSSVEFGDAALAVADPPWYPEHIVAFLWAASRLTRVGGRVLVSLPPVGTRPSILSEREKIISHANTFGLRLLTVEPGTLAYQTPPFERNSLGAVDITAIPGDWRRGDLAHFVTADKACVPRPIPDRPQEAWEEVSIGSVRIKCRARPNGNFRDPTLLPIVPGDMLTSVSRRDPARVTADVWTSGNRIFRCAGANLFRVIMSVVRSGDDVNEAVAAAIGRKLTTHEADLVHRAVEQLDNLVHREELELAKNGYRPHKRDLAKTV